MKAPGMKSIVCSCGAEVTVTRRQAVAWAGRAFVCPSCGRTWHVSSLGLPGAKRGDRGAAPRPHLIAPPEVRREPERTPTTNCGVWLMTLAALAVVAAVEAALIYSLRELKQEIEPAIGELREGARKTSEAVRPAVDLLRTPATVPDQLEELERAGRETTD